MEYGSIRFESDGVCRAGIHAEPAVRARFGENPARVSAYRLRATSRKSVPAYTCGFRAPARVSAYRLRAARRKSVPAYTCGFRAPASVAAYRLRVAVHDTVPSYRNRRDQFRPVGEKGREPYAGTPSAVEEESAAPHRAEPGQAGGLLVRVTALERRVGRALRRRDSDVARPLSLYMQARLQREAVEKGVSRPVVMEIRIGGFCFYFVNYGVREPHCD